jgi:hypothetical protein
MTYRDLLFKENLLDIRIAEGRSIDSIINSPVVARMENVEKPLFLVLKDSRFTLPD